MEFEDCRNGYFFFRKIDSIWGDLTSKHTLNRICTIMRFMKVETLIVEELKKGSVEWRRFNQEREAISLRLGGGLRNIEAIKLSFLRKHAKDKSALIELAKATANGAEDAFLGYAIVVNVTVGKGVWSYIFESVVRELGVWGVSGQWQSLPHHYLHVKKEFSCEIGEVPYLISGTYFRQQNSITNVCAHACVAAMLNNASLPIGIVTAEDLNQKHLLNFDHVKRKFRINKHCLGYEENFPAGPDLPQLPDIFKHYGYKAQILEFDDATKQKKFRSFLYGFVESQFPALLTFGSREDSSDEVGHVVPVVGHTLNLNSWLPVTGAYAVGNWSDKYQSPLGWIDDLIIHDDNFGMQFSLPAHAFKPALNPDKEDNLTPREALGIFPESYNVQMLGNVAESIAASVIRTMAEKTQGKLLDGNYYSKRLWSEQNKTLRQTTILRPILVRWKSYVESLWGSRAMPPDTAKFVDRVTNQGITHVWLVEVTEPDLFVGNQSKVLDVVLNPKFEPVLLNEGEANEGLILPHGTVIMVRLPQRAMIPVANTGSWERISGWEVTGHIPLYSH